MTTYPDGAVVSVLGVFRECFRGFLPPALITYQEKCMPPPRQADWGRGGTYVWTGLGIIWGVEAGRLEL